MKPHEHIENNWRARSWKWGQWLIIAVILWGIHAWQTRDARYHMPPEFRATTHIGETFNFSNWKAHHHQQAYLIYFWSDWCGICQTMTSTMTAIDREFPVLTIASNSGDLDEVNAYLQQKKLTWETVVDVDGTIQQLYGFHGVPALVVVDPHGKVSSVTLGYTTEWGIRARLFWATLNASF